MKYFFALMCCSSMSLYGMSCERSGVEGDPLQSFCAHIFALQQQGKSVHAVEAVCQRVFKESDVRSRPQAQRVFEKLIPLLLDIEHPDVKNVTGATIVLQFILTTADAELISWGKVQFCRILDAFYVVDGFLRPVVWNVVQSVEDAKWKQWACYIIGSKLLDHAQQLVLVR